MLGDRTEIGVRAPIADESGIAGDHRRLTLDLAVERVERVEELAAVMIPFAILADADGERVQRGGSHDDASRTPGKRSCASIGGASS